MKKDLNQAKRTIRRACITLLCTALAGNILYLVPLFLGGPKMPGMAIFGLNITALAIIGVLWAGVFFRNYIDSQTTE